MREFIGHYFTHFIALVVLVSRVGDLLTTYLVSPTLKLEANSLARRFGWKFAFAALLIALVPYYSTGAGVVIATASLLVSATNAMKIMTAKALGEDEYLRFTQSVVARTSFGAGILYVLMPALFMTLLGGFILILFPSASAGWGFPIAIGVLAYAFAIGLWGTVRFLRLKKTATKEEPSQSPEATPTVILPAATQPPRQP